MPLASGRSPKTISKNIREFHAGKTYAHTKAKFGAKRANEQAIAVAMKMARGRADGGSISPEDRRRGMDMLKRRMWENIGVDTVGPGEKYDDTQTSQQTARDRAAGRATASSLKSWEGSMENEIPFDETLPLTDQSTRPIVHRQSGGYTPWYIRNEARNIFHEGLIPSSVPGRTDRHPLNVPGGSYVLPADVVSGLGQGNTLAGSAILDRMFKRAPYGAAMPHMGGVRPPRMAPMRMPAMPRQLGSGMMRQRLFHEGGVASDQDHTPVLVAGGEYILSNEAVKKIGNGDLKRGHEILDRFVKNIRAKTLKQVKKLPGPAKE